MSSTADEEAPGPTAGAGDDAPRTADEAEQAAVPQYDWATGPMVAVADGMTDGGQPGGGTGDPTGAGRSADPDPGTADDRPSPAAP